MEDIQDLFKETIAEFMEDGLEAEVTEELGYSKYDYKNKETENSRNGIVPRSCAPAMGKWTSPSPGTGRGSLSHSC